MGARGAAHKPIGAPDVNVRCRCQTCMGARGHRPYKWDGDRMESQICKGITARKSIGPYHWSQRGESPPRILRRVYGQQDNSLGGNFAQYFKYQGPPGHRTETNRIVSRVVQLALGICRKTRPRGSPHKHNQSIAKSKVCELPGLPVLDCIGCVKVRP